ncbi:hypothetical protein AM1_D0146 (plasmid) [Acaryochloris marina MBIC11017]|uniref:Uncharacterized protein n=1 Tax=Acaryochloris marina (strain MBIC 11017) TaxID=329726 RepID=A8ZNQ5_ACAM1|nr:hypothetical protein AM1_D0146 [Acaryochloris marina MBIC11017]
MTKDFGKSLFKMLLPNHSIFHEWILVNEIAMAFEVRQD